MGIFKFDHAGYVVNHDDHANGFVTNVCKKLNCS